MNKDIANRLRIFIDHKNMSANKFAESVGTSSSQISNMLKAKNFTVDKLTKIFEVHEDLNLHWLITGRGSMFSYEVHNTKQEENNLEILYDTYRHLTFTVIDSTDYLIQSNLIKDEGDIELFTIYKRDATITYRDTQYKYMLFDMRDYDREEVATFTKEIIQMIFYMYIYIDTVLEEYTLVIDEKYNKTDRRKRRSEFNSENDYTLEKNINKMSETLKKMRK